MFEYVLWLARRNSLTLNLRVIYFVKSIFCLLSLGSRPVKIKPRKANRENKELVSKQSLNNIIQKPLKSIPFCIVRANEIGRRTFLEVYNLCCLHFRRLTVHGHTSIVFCIKLLLLLLLL